MPTIELAMDRSSGERPAKRVKHACEPCRRKKAKCPGEQPVCSLCARLNQQCEYAGGRRQSSIHHDESVQSPCTPAISAPAAPEPRATRILEDRLGSLETKMGDLLEVLGQNNLHGQRATAVMNGSMASSRLNSPTPLPSWQKVVSIAKLYLIYCESQPLPLFHRDSFIDSLETRDPEVIYAIIALGIRFSEDPLSSNDLATRISGYTEVARSLIMKRVSEGPVELSTLQSLCLLSLVDFTSGDSHRSSIHSSLAMNLAQCANLESESHPALSPVMREERRRCFWSICLLKCLHGADFDGFDFRDGSLPPFPESSPLPTTRRPSGNVAGTPRITDLQDHGIIAYVIMLSEVFTKTAKYVNRHGKPGNVPPWSSQSEYSRTIALLMDLETRMPYIHRFKPANLNERTPEELQENRAYWGPFFMNQFLYHTILCLLNHPLLLSLSLRNFRSSIPEIFLQHTSDLISTHTTWIIHFINYFQEKSFMASDPFLGYSAAVVATIELQLSFTEDHRIREEKRGRFSKCVGFVQLLGNKWPHMARLADRLQRLEGAVSDSYQPEFSQNKSLLIDLSRFWEILEYSSNSDSDSARRMFGDTLYSGPFTFAAEVSQTSPLPEPTRIHSEHSHSPTSQFGYQTPLIPGLQYTVDPVNSPRPSDLLNDEFSILAANFFSQGQDFLRTGDHREDMGNF